jgi:hypothetical protein
MYPVEISHETFWLKVRNSADRIYWHCTSEDRYQQIVREGYIEPNPSTVSDNQRHKSFVRTLRGVSLFDLKGFSEEEYSAKYPGCNWSYFLPFCQLFEVTIWLEIKLVEGDEYFSGEQLLEKSNKEDAYKHTIMPAIEAAHIGKISFSKVINVFKCISTPPQSTQSRISSASQRIAHHAALALALETPPCRTGSATDNRRPWQSLLSGYTNAPDCRRSWLTKRCRRDQLGECSHPWRSCRGSAFW